MTHSPNKRHLPPAKSAAEYEARLAEVGEVLRIVDMNRWCPVCDRETNDHAPDCRLAALIDTEEKTDGR